ncbi:MAG TPA: VOC family protein [Solimonas sp.]
MQIQPYLFFEGRCEEALALYSQAIGAETLTRMRYRDSPEAPPPDVVPPGAEDKVMHAEFRVGDSVLMGSDGACNGKPGFQGFSLSLVCANAAEGERRFKALADGGTVTMPLGQTFWSPCFGMLVDRYGIGWMINVPPQS